MGDGGEGWEMEGRDGRGRMRDGGEGWEMEGREGRWIGGHSAPFGVLCRMEEQLHDMQSSQREMTQEMEEIRKRCQKFTEALSSITPQVIYAEDSNKRVSCPLKLS